MEVNTVAEYELRRYFFFEILFYWDAKFNCDNVLYSRLCFRGGQLLLALLQRINKVSNIIILHL